MNRNNSNEKRMDHERFSRGWALFNACCINGVFPDDVDIEKIKKIDSIYKLIKISNLNKNERVAIRWSYAKICNRMSLYLRRDPSDPVRLKKAEQYNLKGIILLDSFANNNNDENASLNSVANNELLSFMSAENRGLLRTLYFNLANLYGRQNQLHLATPNSRFCGAKRPRCVSERPALAFFMSILI